MLLVRWQQKTASLVAATSKDDTWLQVSVFAAVHFIVWQFLLLVNHNIISGILDRDSFHGQEIFHRNCFLNTFYVQKFRCCNWNGPSISSSLPASTSSLLGQIIFLSSRLLNTLNLRPPSISQAKFHTHIKQ